MKKLVLLLFSIPLFSQVGIGTVSPKGALEINSATNGLLLPRVALTAKNIAAPVVNPQGGVLDVSTLIYNTATAGIAPNNVDPGYYYWDGAQWVKLNTGAGSSGASWLLTGNTVTNTDYIGTNSWHSFKIKAGGTQLGTIEPNGSVFLGLNASGSTSNAFVFGPRSQANSSESFAIGPDVIANGWHSFGIGSAAHARGSYSTALGWKANTGALGSSSIAIGEDAYTNANAALSIGRLATATGDDAIAIGYNSTSSNSQSFALGASTIANNVGATAIGSGATSSGLYSTAIGYQATTSQNNAIVLGNSSSVAAKVGIGTNTPNTKLHIVSSTASEGLQIQDGSQGVNKVLTSDANGKATWSAKNADWAYAEVNKSAGTALPSSGNVVLGGTTTSFGAVTLGADYISVDKAGLYKITYHVCFSKNGAVGAVRGYFLLSKWGTAIPATRSNFTVIASETGSVSLTKYVTLAAWEAVQLDAVVTSGTASDVTVLSNGTLISLEFVQ